MSIAGMLYALNLQEALQLFVTRFDSLLSASNPVRRAKGFTASLHSLYQRVPQQIAQAIASKLAPMQLLWIMVAQADALLRAEAAPPRRRWWHQLKRSTAISPSPDVSSYQFLWTDPKHCTDGLPAHDPCKSLPGTGSTEDEILQEPPAIPPFTEHTPRMVQLDIGVDRGTSHERKRHPVTCH
ncbi:MAG: hypothetical protein FRX49_04782, partial [Trebouxia sp. A1-2]